MTTQTQNMENTLKIGKTNGTYSFGVYAGLVRLAKFKTQNEAEKSLLSKKSFYEYWAGSASVTVDNSAKNIVWI